MVFGLFKKKDPVCGMKEEKGKGLLNAGNWFCSDKCHKEYEQRMKEAVKKFENLPSCCRK